MLHRALLKGESMLVSLPTCRRVREVFESIFSNRGFRIDFASLGVVSYSGRRPLVVPPEATRWGGVFTPAAPAEAQREKKNVRDVHLHA